MITGYREQPKMGPTFKKSPTASTTKSITVGSRSQPNASLAISSPRMGPMPPSNYQPRSAPVSLTVGSRTPEAVPNKNVERFSQGSFGVGKEYDRYTNMFQRQIDEGSTLERAMYRSKTSTPQDHINAFGNRDNWRTWTGGNKMGSAGAAVNAARRAQKANRDARRNNDAFSIPSLNNVMMAVTPWAKVGAWEKNFLQDSLRNIQTNQPSAYQGELNRLRKTYPGFPQV
jgi:hypothetical protein